MTTFASLQRRSLTTSAADHINTSAVIRNGLPSAGRPLDANTQSFMQSRFNHDFSGVRVHTDGKAAESAQSANAQAYTVGQNIVFGRDRYAPGSAPGRRLLAHELAHVVQQSRTATAASSGSRTAEQEAGTVADRIHQGRTAGPLRSVPSPAFQRQPDDGPSTPEYQFGQQLELENLDRMMHELRLLRLRLASDPEEIMRILREMGFSPPAPTGPTEEGAESRPDASRLFDPEVMRRAVEETITPTPPYATPVVPGSPLPPAGQSTGYSLDPFSLSRPYPGTGSDILSAGLATPYGQRFKSFALGQLGRIWTDTTIGEKIIIGVNLGAALGLMGYGVYRMTPDQRRSVTNTVFGDSDIYLQRPLDKKVFTLDWTF